MLMAVTHGLGSASFVVLLLLMLINRRPRGVGLFAFAVFATTALWAAVVAAQIPALTGVAHLLGSARSWIWLQFIATILILAQPEGLRRTSTAYRIFIPVIGALAVINDMRFLTGFESQAQYAPSQIIFSIILAIIGILMVENLFRNSVPTRRWHIVPFCLAAGFLFAYELFVFVDAIVVGSILPTLLSGRGVVLVLIMPLLLLTMARNEDWRVNVHVSRRVVFHTATMSAGGLFLVLAAGVASIFGDIAGEWSGVVEVLFFCGALLVLATVIATDSIRSHAWRVITENFFSHRYDYREEWLRLVETLSAADATDPLHERVIQALANVVESPGGVLWLEDDRGDYRVSTCLNMDMDQDAIEPAKSAFLARFEAGHSVLELSKLIEEPEGARLPIWLRGGTSPWLAVPLVDKDRLVGFIILARPHEPIKLNWESFSLLRTIGRQVASYLIEEKATRSLTQAAAIAEYNKRFAFVVHDIKNLVSQLGMLVANLRKFGYNPEFQADMISTLENSVDRMNGLLTRLRTGAGEQQEREFTDPVKVLKNVLQTVNKEGVQIEIVPPEIPLRVQMNESELHSVLMHLVVNAVEASPRDGTVRIGIYANDGKVTIDVEDEGSGMEPAFIRDDLFTPFHSTKRDGHGIGAFQARELVRAAGGELKVKSELGQGTMMRISMPSIGPKLVKPVEEALRA